jgi:hypothetical protein
LDSNGKKIYIGRGTFNGVVTPGRFLFENNGQKQAGVYVEQYKAERFSSKNVDYYASNPNCNYSWVESCSGKKVKNAVVSSSIKPYYIGRVFAANSLQIGKVLVGDKMYYAPKFSAVNYTVLVCNRKKQFFLYLCLKFI